MRMRSIVGAVEEAVNTALARTPWERDPPVRADHRERAGDWSAQEVSLVWCAADEAVRSLYPHLPQAHGNQPGGCVDVWIHIDGDGLLTEVNVEGESLSDTFRLMQRPEEAEEVDNLIGLPTDVVAPRLARHLVDVLSDRRTTGG